MRSLIHFILPAISLVSLIAIRLRRTQRQLLRNLESGVFGSRTRSRRPESLSESNGIESRNSLTGAGHV